jgi:hypothetical protein
MQVRNYPFSLVTQSWAGYTSGMKTAISLPDELFFEAEEHARHTHKTRSQLYSEALQEYLVRHSPDQVTEAMNRVLDQLNEPVDPFVSEAARQTMERIEW